MAKDRRSIKREELIEAHKKCFVHLIDRDTKQDIDVPGEVTGYKDCPHQGIFVHVDTKEKSYFVPMELVFVEDNESDVG